jgi:hypothetical protein
MRDCGSKFSGSPLEFIAKSVGDKVGRTLARETGPFERSGTAWNVGDCGRTNG